MERCKKAGLSVEETELIHLFLVGRIKPMSLRELAKMKGMSPAGMSYKINKLKEKIREL